MIEPPDRSVHRAIAHRFIIDVATSDAAALGAIIDGGDEDWWRQWNDRLSAVGLLERWRRYRSAAFESRLVEALRSRQLDDDLVDAAVASALTQRASTSANGKTRQSWLRVNCSDRAQLERVLRKVLGQMSINDLRDISVPIGLVLDAVEAD